MVDFDELFPKEILFYNADINPYQVMFISKNPWSENEYIFIEWNTVHEKGLVKSIKKDYEKNFFKSLDDFLDEIRLAVMKKMEQEIENKKEMYKEVMDKVYDEQ